MVIQQAEANSKGSNTPKPTLFFRNNNKTIRCQKPRQHHLVHPICFVIANDCLIRLLEYNPGLWLNSKWWMRLSKAGQQQWDRCHSGSDILSNFVQCRIMPRGLIFYLATLQMIEDRDTLKQKKGKHSTPSLRPMLGSQWGHCDFGFTEQFNPGDLIPMPFQGFKFQGSQASGKKSGLSFVSETWITWIIDELIPGIGDQTLQKQIICRWPFLWDTHETTSNRAVTTSLANERYCTQFHKVRTIYHQSSP